eukprot:1158471-Pelagomonas_calceolata.AAC.3
MCTIVVCFGGTHRSVSSIPPPSCCPQGSHVQELSAVLRMAGAERGAQNAEVVPGTLVQLHKVSACEAVLAPPALRGPGLLLPNCSTAHHTHTAPSRLWGADSLWLHVRASREKALDLYMKQGFRPPEVATPLPTVKSLMGETLMKVSAQGDGDWCCEASWSEAGVLVVLVLLSQVVQPVQQAQLIAFFWEKGL